jgi:hypothetical protein
MPDHYICQILSKLLCGLINKTQLKKNYGGRVLLVASQILLDSLLLVKIEITVIMLKISLFYFHTLFKARR